jgi:hypothetical protein
VVTFFCPVRSGLSRARTFGGRYATPSGGRPETSGRTSLDVIFPENVQSDNPGSTVKVDMIEPGLVAVEVVVVVVDIVVVEFL